MRAVLVTVVLVLPAPAAAQAYRLRIKATADVGKSVNVTEKVSETVSFTAFDSSGKVVDQGKTTRTSLEAYTEQVVEADRRSGRKVRRTWKKAVAGEGKAKTTQPYQGRAVLFRNRDGQPYTAAADGKPALPREVLERLARRLAGDERKRDLPRPREPVRVGETWPIDGKEFERLFFPGVDTSRTSGRGKLVRVYRKDGKRFGVLEYRFSYVAPGRQGEGPARGEITLVLDTPIDGSAAIGRMTLKSRATQKGTVEREGKKLTIDGTTEMTVELEQTEG